MFEKLKNFFKRKKNENNVIKDKNAHTNTDVMGSYTGTPTDEFYEVPQQDADDL